MKVFIINPISKGGICHYSYGLSNALYKEDIELIYITSQEKNEIDYFSPKFPVKKVLHPLVKSFLFKNIRYSLNKKIILDLVKKEKPEVIHFQWPLSARLDPGFIKTLKKKGIRVIYTAHNLLPHEPEPGDKKRYYRIYQAVDQIIVHAQQNKEELEGGFNISPKKINVIPHGNFLFVSKLNPELTTGEARKILGLEKNDFILLFFGNIRPYRGLDILLKAMVYLKNISQIKLLVVGRIFNRSLCEDLIDLLKVRDSVNFYLEYIPLKYLGQYFYACDVAVFPYHNIYQSGAIQMAYAFGKPIISTRVGGISEIVEEGKSGLLVPPEDPKILAKAILKMYNVPREKIREAGKYAYNFAGEKFSWDKIAEQTIRVYNLK